MSHASSTLFTRVSASSGPKISSLSTGESSGRSATSVGAQNQPSSGTDSTCATGSAIAA